MELEINNFRNVTHRILNFDTGIHLFEGESGIGKTTCLEAIQWVLYGGKNVYPFGYDKSKKELTKVIFTLPEMKITRTKPPECILVEFKGSKKLEFAEAQSYIDQHFGSKTFWESSYYLKQDHRNLLLFGSKEEKNNIVKEIVFGSESSQNTPDKYLSKVEEYLYEIDIDILAKQKMVQYILERMEEKEVNITENEIVRLAKFYPKQEDIQNKLEIIKDKIREKEENSKRKMRKIQINMELRDYPNLTLSFVEKWKKWLSCCQQLQEMKMVDEGEEVGDVEQIKREIYELERRKKIYYPNIKKIERLNRSDIFQKLNGGKKVTYEKEIIIALIKEFDEKKIDIIKYQNYLEKRNGILKIVEKIKEMRQKIKDFETSLTQFGDIENLEEIKEKLMELKTNLMKCPKCHKKLILCEGQLKEGKGTPTSKKKLTEYAGEYKKLQEYHIWKQGLESLQSMYSSMSIPVSPKREEGNNSEIEKMICILKDIEVVEFSEDEYQMKQKILERAEYFLKRKNLLETKENNYLGGMENLIPPNNIDTYYQDYQSLKEELKIIESSIFQDDNDDLEIKKERGDKLLLDLKRYEKYLLSEREADELEKENILMGKLMDKREDCLKLKKIIQEESSVTFENLMISFNQILNDIVSEIFDDIHIEIGMFKKLKTKGEIKPQFNMKVTLKGHEYDNLGFLSGGEKDRMSVALMVTLAKLGKGEIVMLDETMSSLDEEMRHQMLELIKKHLPDKIVLVVCHSTIEGYYDSVIRF